MHEHTEHEALHELAERFGIASEYHDIFGQRHLTDDQTARAILKAMGARVETAGEVGAELAACRDATWRRPCDPVLVRQANAADGVWSFRMPAQEDEERDIRIEWTIHDETGLCRWSAGAGPGLGITEDRLINDHRYVRFELPLPSGLDIGYYDLAAGATLSARRVEGRLRLILTPPHCYQPDVLNQGGRLWGLTLQLYALRSARNWGVGDFTDLRECVHWAAELGAGVVGLNPLHALKNTRPYHISPYSPDSRFYLNVLYVDLERIPELAESIEAQRLLTGDQFRFALESLRKEDTVDYEAVAAAKQAVLELLFATFEQRHCVLRDGVAHAETARGRAFAAFVRQEGRPLELFAVFRALSEALATSGRLAWTGWPAEYRHPDHPDVIAFKQTHRSRIRFHQYLQWVAADQLREIAVLATQLGMPVGLYHDLALGSDRTGSDAWICQDLLALEADCGAPPDAIAPEGQNWGLPPVNPVRLREDGYRLFIGLLRKNLQFGGALRLDHVMALFRLFWIPRGMPASAGAYVQYPWQDLLGILALESVRHRALIIGEDLGTVPEMVREKLSAFRVLSYRVFYFERTDAGDWKPARDYPRDALAVIATHDLPTLAGYWAGKDLDIRFQLGSFADEAAYRMAVEQRQSDKARMVEALNKEGLIPDARTEEWIASTTVGAELSHAVHAYVAHTPSSLMLTSLEDLLDSLTQVNVPGTLDSYPNWSQKTPLLLQDLRHAPKPRRLAAVLREIRPAHSSL